MRWLEREAAERDRTRQRVRSRGRLLCLVSIPTARNGPCYRARPKKRCTFVLSRGGKAEAPPSFAGGRIFVRNDEEIAAVTIGN